MIRINLLKTQPKPLTDAEKTLLEGMMMNAYRQGIAQGERNCPNCQPRMTRAYKHGLAQGERNMAAKVITRCRELDRRSAERRRGERRDLEGGISEKK